MATSEWFKSPYPGVTYKKHDTRKHGVKFDVYYRGQFQGGGKRRTIGFGWQSEGWTEKDVFERLQTYKRNAKLGQGPTTLKEEQAIAKQEKARKEREQAERDKVRVTFSEFFNTYYITQCRKDKTEKQCRQEEAYCRNWIFPVIGTKLIQDVSALDIDKIKNAMLKKDKAPQTIKHVLAVIRQVYNRAIALEFYDRVNPIKRVKIPKVDANRTRFFTPAEIKALLTELGKRSKTTHDISLTSLHCGLRASEVFRLRWQDVNFETRIITIPKTKNGEGKFAYMTRDLETMLQERKAAQEKKLKCEITDTDLVFPARNGKVRKAIGHTFDRAIDTLGLNAGKTDRKDRAVFHTLRHTFASWHVQQGTALFEVQKMLGQKSFAMVQRYSHLASENMQKATAPFDKPEGKLVPFPTPKAVNGQE